MDEYENQRLTGSQLALATLLEEIIQNKHMALKDKKKRLKQVRTYQFYTFWYIEEFTWVAIIII